MSKWIPKEDETIWRISDIIASGSSKAIYKTHFLGAIHNGFNVFRTEQEAKEARDAILIILEKNMIKNKQGE